MKHMLSTSDNNLAAVIKTTQGAYRVMVGRGIIESIGLEMAAADLHGRAFIVADQALFPAGVRRCQEALEAGGYPANVLTIPSGEPAKSLDTARQIYEWLGGQRAERSDVIVALGGGVTGDLVGFVAATWLRGVAFVQAPTSLAAMVDASIGGKVAVNLPIGKNLVGAFHQPKLVMAEVDYLQSLSRRELASGWAEAIKHGLIADASLLDTFETHAGEMMSLSGEAAVKAIRRSVAIKAEVVSADEFETGDTRVLLNYGHTVGHALEAVTGYGKLLHGEAVSVGMMAAARISQRMGMISGELVDRQRAILERYGLPVRASGVSVDAVLEATRSDKKTRGGAIRWVLLDGVGKATTRRDVPENTVFEAVGELLR
ncbi:MAG: 3-dehydroquinate synthase [Dehalococcoidia bacterium]|nr:3-dehydroquinate synthase [Dehalococcoidia bacterium]MSQ34641.1 3-dehydroquinate synthase [Dehalococcoidia bacterium]